MHDSSAPMTVVDVEQGLVHGLENTFWGEAIGSEWDAIDNLFLTGAFG